MGERGIEPASVWPSCGMSSGYDQPLWRQFVSYEGQLRTAISAPPWSRGRAVWSEFATLFPATLELAVCAILFADRVVGLPLGVIAAVRRGTAFDYGLMGIVRHRRLHADLLVGADDDPRSSPSSLGWTPVSGRISDAVLRRAVVRLHD